MTINEAFEMYMLNKKCAGIRSSTLESNRYLYDSKVKNVIGNDDIESIDKTSISEAFELWKEECRLPTLKSIKKLLSAFLNFLVREEILLRNPCKAIRLEPHSVDVRILTDDEVKILLKSARHTELYPQVLLLVTTGLRHGEMDGLQWQDIDFANRSISIRRTYRNGKESAVKTKSSLRTISISSKLISALTKQQKIVRDKHGKTCKWVFPSRLGKPLSASGFGTKVSDFLAKISLPHVVVHSFRHYHATYLMQKSDLPIIAIKERLGWSSAAMLYERYGHVTQAQRYKLAQYVETDF